MTPRAIVTTAIIAVQIHLAHADATSANAEALFRQGRELLAAGKIAEACAAFDSSDELETATSTLINRADCRERHGELATAWGLFVDAERRTRNSTDARGIEFHRLAAVRAQLLEPRLSHLTIQVPDDLRAQQLTIARNSTVLSAGEWGRALPIDGGSYTIRVSAPGYRTWSTTLTVARERDAKTVVIPPLRPLPSWFHAHSGTVALGAGALAALGAGLALEVVAEHTASRSLTAPVSQRIALWQKANRDRHIAMGIAGAGIACAGVALWVYLHHNNDEGDEALGHIGRAAVQPVVTPSGGGLVLFGRF